MGGRLWRGVGPWCAGGRGPGGGGGRGLVVGLGGMGIEEAEKGEIEGGESSATGWCTR